MPRPTTYPESHVGHGKNVAGHERRGCNTEGRTRDPGFLDEQLPLYEHVNQAVEEPDPPSLPRREELYVDVSRFLDTDQTEPAHLDEEGVQYVGWPNNVYREPEEVLRILCPTNPPVLLDVAVPRGGAELRVTVRRMKSPHEAP